MPNYYDLEAKMGTVSRPEYPKGVSDYRLKIKVYLAKKEDFDRYEIQSLNDETEIVIAITTKRNAKPENDRWVKVDALIHNHLLKRIGDTTDAKVPHDKLKSVKAIVSVVRNNQPISQVKKFSF